MPDETNDSIDPQRVCACGCGEQVTGRRKWVRGHAPSNAKRVQLYRLDRSERASRVAREQEREREAIELVGELGLADATASTLTLKAAELSEALAAVSRLVAATVTAERPEAQELAGRTAQAQQRAADDATAARLSAEQFAHQETRALLAQAELASRQALVAQTAAETAASDLRDDVEALTSTCDDLGNALAEQTATAHQREGELAAEIDELRAHVATETARADRACYEVARSQTALAQHELTAAEVRRSLTTAQATVTDLLQEGVAAATRQHAERETLRLSHGAALSQRDSELATVRDSLRGAEVELELLRGGRDRRESAQRTPARRPQRTPGRRTTLPASRRGRPG